MFGKGEFMLIAKNDEAKRSKIWRIGMFISSAIIVLVASYFFIKVFNENPITGKWVNEEGNYRIHFLNNGKMYVTDLDEEGAEELELSYVLDKEAKSIEIVSEEGDFGFLYGLGEAEYLEDAIETEFNDQTVVFNYSVDGDKLIFTEREYGEQMMLIKE